MKNIVKALAVLTVIATFERTAAPYSYSYCWVDCTWPLSDLQDNYNWDHVPTLAIHENLGTGSSTCSWYSTTNYLNDFECGVDAWYKVFSSWFYFNTTTGGTFGSVTYGDGLNYVAFTDLNFGGALAITTTRTNCSYNCVTSSIDADITESDIEFNPDPNAGGTDWIVGPPHPDPANCCGAPYAFRAVAVHELGHALGLGHVNGFVADLLPTYPMGGWARGNSTTTGLFLPEPDDRAGDAYLYPAQDSDTDLAVVPFRINGGGTYSDITSSNTEICRTVGQTFPIKFTVQNLSDSNVSGLRLGYYLSTNDWISTADTLITSESNLSINAYSQFDRNVSLTTPNVSVGLYYVGPFIDDQDAVTGEQWTSDNNGARIVKLRIKASCP